jgi:hypothetical protein
MAVKKSFVSALPLQLAAAVLPPAGGVAVAANEGEDAAAEGDGLNTVAAALGLETVPAGLAAAGGTVGLASVEPGVAGEPHEAAASPRMRRRIAGRGRSRIPARARITGGD